MRCFIAIDVPDLSTVQDPLREIEGVKPTNAYHLTLKFLGDVPDEKLQELVENLSDVSFSPFSLTLNGIGGFPNLSRPRVVFVNVEESETLRNLANDVDNATKQTPMDKKFHPHVTIARIRKPVQLPRVSAEKRTFDVKEFTLYKSTLAPEGPRYEKIQTYLCVS